MSDEILVHRADGLCTVILNRPGVMNAAGPSMLFALTELVEGLTGDETLSAVIITGARRAFSAGGDFEHFVRTSRKPDYADATLANCMWRLLEERETRWERVKRDPALIEVAIEESLRFDTPVLGMETRLALTALVERLPDISLVGPTTRIEGFNFWECRTLPVAWRCRWRRMRQ